MISTSEIIEEAGGIESLLKKWATGRAFPWHPDGFEKRAERREFRFDGIQWPEIGEDEDDEDVIQDCRRQCSESNAAFDAECERYVRIADADERDTFGHLTHAEFCDTAYWLGLATWMKRRAEMQCFDCGRKFEKTGELQVHHKTYRNRGREYPDHLNDLVVLCGNCHGKRHGKQTEQAARRQGGAR